MTEDPAVIRSSSLSGFADCPRRAASRMFRELILSFGYTLNHTMNGIGAAVGTSVHHGAAFMLKEKAVSGVLPPASVDDDVGIETLRAEIAPGVLYDKTSPERSIAEAQVRRMIKAYRSEVAPGIQPKIVEQRFEAQVSKDIVISGQPDLICLEPGCVDDLKCGARIGNHAPQIGAYTMLARANGMDIQKARITWLPRAPMTKSRQPNPQPPPQNFVYDLAISETAAINVLRHIEDDLKVFKEGDPLRGIEPGDRWAFMANPSSLLCGPRWCPAHSSDFCPECRPSYEGPEEW